MSVTPNMAVCGTKPLEAGKQARKGRSGGCDEGIESVQTLEADKSLTWHSSLPKWLVDLAKVAFRVLRGWRLPLFWLHRTRRL